MDERSPTPDLTHVTTAPPPPPLSPQQQPQQQPQPQQPQQQPQPQQPQQLSQQTQQPLDPRPAQRGFAAIAPWWHTLLIIAAFAIYAVLSHAHSHLSQLTVDANRALTYLSQMWLTWVLFGATVAGIWMRRDFFLHTLSHKAVSWKREWRRGVAIYLAAFVMNGVLLSLAVGARLVYDLHQASHAQTQSHSSPAPSPSPSLVPSPAHAHSSAHTARPLTPLTPTPVPTPKFDIAKTSRDHITRLFDQKITRTIAPKTPLELLLWILVSLTAGFAEEHIFRGYLLQQFLAACSRLHLSRSLAMVCAVLLSSLLFGSLHLYEGIGGAALVTCLGILYASLALRFENLRAVMVAHFLQDFLAGLMLFIAYSRHAF